LRGGEDMVVREMTIESNHWKSRGNDSKLKRQTVKTYPDFIKGAET